MTEQTDENDFNLATRKPRASRAPSESGVVFPLRVRYFETDQMGVVHHANYPVWFEAARSEYCRVHGIDYRGMEADGLALPVVQLTVRYIGAAHYEDELNIRASVVDCRRSLLRIRYSVERDGKILATGETVQMLVERSSGKPRSFSADIAARFLGGPTSSDYATTD